MKPLPEIFTKKGFQHRLEWREGNVAVYRRWKGEACHWEVVVVREQKSRVMRTPSGCVDLPHAELYPGSEQWGTYGWTYLDLEAAKRKASQITGMRDGQPLLNW